MLNLEGKQGKLILEKLVREEEDGVADVLALEVEEAGLITTEKAQIVTLEQLKEKMKVATPLEAIGFRGVEEVTEAQEADLEVKEGVDG